METDKEVEQIVVHARVEQGQEEEGGMDVNMPTQQ